MRAIMFMFDSLNRHMLPPYGCDWVHAPNFQRLAEHSVTFDKCYVGSMPCMPARRELHTGRYNFLHRSWGPLEPFDFSMPQALRENGIYTHLATDHYHYWEDGGCTYHNRYSSYEFFRGQEGDAWKGVVAEPELPENLTRAIEFYSRKFFTNLPYLEHEEDHYQTLTVNAGVEFIKTNHHEDNWFLHLECFDPHEPWYSPDKYHELYDDDYEAPERFWPAYGPVKEEEPMVRHLRKRNAALISMCDASLGRVLDLMDEHDMWKDTMLIVNTDHGFLMNEHEQWGKCWQPFYEEVSHTPLFIWDPRSGRKGERCDSLVQTIDLAPTLLELFGVERPETMQGMPLREALASNAPVHDAILFGIHGGQVHCSDGRYVYMRAPQTPVNKPLYNYTLMPGHMTRRFQPYEFEGMELAGPFSFTEGCQVMKIVATWGLNPYDLGTILFDLETDPHQERPLDDADQENRMKEVMKRLMDLNDAPPDQFERLGF